MVLWGPNQVFNIPGNANAAPAPGAFGAAPPPPAFGAAPAAAPAFGGFGAAPAAPAFGKAATGSLFGAKPAAAPLFGSPAPAAAGGFFGSPPAAAAPAAPPAQPAQVALQAGIAAEARQEAAKMKSALQHFHETYTGTGPGDKKSSPLITIVYQNMSPQQLAWYYSTLQSGGTQCIPPKPPQVSQQDWLKAVVNNPDPTTLIPVALVGAEQLQARVGWQQDTATKFSQNTASLTSAVDDVQRRSVRYRQDLKDASQNHEHLKSKLLKVMTKVEVLRCMNLPLQKDEMELVQRLQKLVPQMQQAPPQVPAVLDVSRVEVPDKERLQQIFTKQRQQIVSLSETVQKDQRDLKLLQERVAKN